MRPSTRASGGISCAQRGMACGQRGWKRQPDGRVERARHLARRARSPRAARRDGSAARRRTAPSCRDAAALVGERARLAALDDLAQVHDHDRVAHVGDGGEVVGDEEVGQAEPRLQVAQQVEDLGADRDVERRDRLVQHDQPRRQRPARGRWRCAGAGRRRTRAGRDRPSAPAGRPGRAAPARARRTSAGSIVSLVISGSAMMALTRMRGLSEAYGSWNTACTDLR